MRERSALLALVLAAGCATGSRDAPPADPKTPAIEATAVARTGAADVVWAGATQVDLRLADEVVAEARAALDRLLPALAPFGGTPVRIVVSDAPQPVGSAYLLASREVRIERRYLNRLNLAHETSHALLHARLGFPPPVWLDEAAAQLAAYRVEHGADLAPPPGRPLGDFAALRALTGRAWTSAGGAAYADSANWLGYLLPAGPASDEEKAAFARYLAGLVATHDPVAADAELAVVDRAASR